MTLEVSRPQAAAALVQQAAITDQVAAAMAATA
jgi:hypothetical protein